MAYSGGVKVESGWVVVVVSTTVGATEAIVTDVVSGVRDDDVVDSGAELDVHATAKRATATMRMPVR
jgi:hypothetical protein